MSFDPVNPFLGIDAENAPAEIQLMCRVIRGGMVCDDKRMEAPYIAKSGRAVEETIVRCCHGARSDYGTVEKISVF